MITKVLNSLFFSVIFASILVIDPLACSPSFQDSVQQRLQKDYPGQEIRISFDYPESLKKLPNNPQILTHKVIGNNRVQLTIKDMMEPLTVRVDLLIDVPVLNKPLSSSHIIQEADLITLKVPLSSLNGPYALRNGDLLGKQPRQQKVLPAMTPLQTSDLISPIVIKRDGLVRIVYRAGNLSLSTQGKALKDGAIGQRVTFEAGKVHKKIIEAVVIDAHTAEIHAPTL